MKEILDDVKHPPKLIIPKVDLKEGFRPNMKKWKKMNDSSSFGK